MPIEIKELRIKAVIAPPDQKKDKAHSSLSYGEIQRLKKEIVRECLDKIKEQMRERAER